MARICNSKAKVYEAKGFISDEPVEHLESEGERLIKQMVKKQLNTDANLEQELNREKCFRSVAETLPLTEYVSGETTLKEFEQTAAEVSHIEELKSFGLTYDEIEILVNYERDVLKQMYKKREKSVLSARIQHILEKVQCAKKERESSLVKSESINNNRHHRDLGLCVKPESEHTKLLNFVLSCQKTKSDSRPQEHPINRLKDIEEELFGHLTKRSEIPVVQKSKRRSVKSSSSSKQSAPTYSYKKGTTLWDVTSNSTEGPPQKKAAYSTNLIYTCKPEYLYTIQNGKIIPAHKVEEKGRSENDSQRSNDEYVVTDIKASEIPLVPLQSISSNCLSLQEIKSIPKFSGYSVGSVSKDLYLKNLAGSATHDDLVSLFGHFESDSESRVVYRLLTGRMRGQAFVSFPNSALAKKALELVNGYMLKGKPIIIQYGKGKTSVDGK